MNIPFIIAIIILLMIIFESLSLINVMNFQELINGFQNIKINYVIAIAMKIRLLMRTLEIYTLIAFFRNQLSDLTENSAILI